MDQQIAQKPKPDILMLALARHDGLYSSTAWSLAKAFSKQSRVIYVDNPFTINDLWSGKKREQLKKRYRFGFFRKKKVLRPEPSLNLLVLVPPIMLSVNWLPDGRLYRLLSRFNNFLLKKAVNEVLRNNHFHSYIYINSFNPFYGKTGDFKPSPVQFIYQTVDEIAHSNYVRKHGPRLEEEAMRKADVVVTTSRQLQKKASALKNEVVYIPNAADIDLFRQSLEVELEIPLELKEEKRKVICYTGHIDKRLDYELLVAVAKLHPNKLFLMVGPISGSEVTDSGFSNLPNVKFTGKKELKELPAYLQHSHCTIIPFKCNELTKSIYPLKINEYLAAGKGVVATPFSKDMEDFADVVFLTSSSEEFSEAIEKIMNSNDLKLVAARKLRALKNTWEARVDAFYELLENGRHRGGLAEQKAHEETIE